LRIAICDDQAECRHQAEAAIRSCLQGTDLLIDQFKDGSSFLRQSHRSNYDLVFLDVEMPEMDGFALAKQLRKQENQVPIIFLTSHVELAMEGYEVNALRYLTKPVNMKKLQEVLSYVLRQIREQRVIWVKSDLLDLKLQVKDILYMEARNQNVLIATATDTYSVRYNLSDYEEELRQDDFVRIHRGYLVSLAHVKSVGKGELLLDDGTTLPVSRTKENGLKQALWQYIRRVAI
jgi:two-component system response regulator LytT